MTEENISEELHLNEGDALESSDTAQISNLLMNEEKDWFLSEMVELANAGIEAPVTLTIGGSVLSGKLISGEQYFRNYGSTFTSTIKDLDLRKNLTEKFESYAVEYANDTAEKSERPLRFIHLKDAKWHHLSGTMPNGDGVLWRGKISCVDGFFLGNIVYGK